MNTEYDGAVAEAPSDSILVEDVGWIISKNRRTLTLAASRDLKHETVRTILTIPTRMVREIVYLTPLPPMLDHHDLPPGDVIHES